MTGLRPSLNRPLTTGDRLWADAGARAEIQVGGASVRMDGATYVSILNLDDNIAQLQLSQGTMNVHVRRLDPNQAFEIDTPNLAFTVRQPGDYRIAVDAAGDATEIVVRRGQGDVYGEGASYTLDSRQTYRFTGTGLNDYQTVASPRLDDFIAGRSIATACMKILFPRDTFRRTSSATRTSMPMARGAATRPTATCGYPGTWPPTGRRIATAIGPGSTRGAGPG